MRKYRTATFRNLILISFRSLTFFSCDGNPAGDGLGLPAGINGSELWETFNADIYLPDQANGTEAVSGTFPCADGGQATVQHTKSDSVETSI